MASSAPAAEGNKGGKPGEAEPLEGQEYPSEQLTFTKLLPRALP